MARLRSAGEGRGGEGRKEMPRPEMPDEDDMLSDGVDSAARGGCVLAARLVEVRCEWGCRRDVWESC